MRIQLNGDPFELPDGETVAALLTRLDLTGALICRKCMSLAITASHAGLDSKQ